MREDQAGGQYKMCGKTRPHRARIGAIIVASSAFCCGAIGCRGPGRLWRPIFAQVRALRGRQRPQILAPICGLLAYSSDALVDLMRVLSPASVPGPPHSVEHQSLCSWLVRGGAPDRASTTVLRFSGASSDGLARRMPHQLPARVRATAGPHSGWRRFSLDRAADPGPHLGACGRICPCSDDPLPSVPRCARTSIIVPR